MSRGLSNRRKQNRHFVLFVAVNQSDAKVSVVRVGQSEGDAENGDLTLTVDPPTFERAATTENTSGTTAGASDVAGLVDPFMEMDPEQLEKLEEALQSEQAKQILGENVTAMLGRLIFIAKLV